MEHLSRTTIDTTDQGDQEILAFILSDEALEAAAGTEKGASRPAMTTRPFIHFPC